MAGDVELREYLDASGRSPFAAWFERLNPHAAAKVTASLARLAQRNVGAMKSVGSGVHELKVHFGPGYRIYLAWDGSELVILLAGGTKVRQQRDIQTSIARWRDYKQRKRLTN